MLEVKDLTIEINDKTIIDHLTFVVNKQDKIAIIGEEGNGKSTILKALAGVLSYGKQTGCINAKDNIIGHMNQFLEQTEETKSVFDYLFSNDEEYYQTINQFYHLQKQLSLDSNILELDKMKNLSGGERVKIQLLKVLIGNPDILLLDEPTNDLDVDALEWLERFINQSATPIVYVSHDETLLSKTANKIIHLEQVRKKTQSRNTVLISNYDDYVKERLENINRTTSIAKKEQQNYEKQIRRMNQIKDKVAYQQETITRKDPHTAQMLKKKMKSIKSQERRIENQPKTELPDYEDNVQLKFEMCHIPKQKEILSLENESVTIMGKVIAESINLDVIGPVNVAIVGKNGVGKTTLLKKIYQKLLNRRDIKVGYMPQAYDEILTEYETPVELLETTGKTNQTIRSRLGTLNVTRDEMVSPISSLSGGTKAKLLLLKLILEECNVLLLDEPTRNVSPLSNPIIRKALKDYSGTIIAVSHDRKYIKEVSDIVYELTPTGLIKK